MSTDRPDHEQAKTKPMPGYEPPAIVDLGPLVQVTAGTGTRQISDVGGASV